ncbi:hypothetical protein [Desulfobacter latus]|uniref:Uncharacterized protein n=1 Tax=Desulfobacter latus TaxID=2292 RepID=A0A850T975_9BACT|nr:hypothetical protein [Desulfobacter latus]NWH05048.1 hypothetical protein [Desulfobacter latus]
MGRILSYRNGTFIVLLIILLSFINTTEAIPSENELKNKYLEILENGVDCFEPFYKENSSTSNTGFFDLRDYGNWTHPRNESYHTLCIIPGNGQVILTYAVLLKYSHKEFFGQGHYSRKIIFDHLVKTIRWICLSSSYVPKSLPYLPEARDDIRDGEQWHRKWGLRQDLLGYLSVGAALVWPDLTEEIRSLLGKVFAGTGIKGRLIRTTQKGNGNHDQVKQDLSSTIGAAFLLTEHPDHDKYWEFVTGAGIDMVSTVNDFVSHEIVENKMLKSIAAGANLNSDYSSFHHNHPSVWYGIDLIFEGRSYVEILSKLTELDVPETYTYNGNGFDGVHKYAMILSTKAGVINHLRSPEYDSSYGAGLLAFCYGAVLKNDSTSIELEKNAAGILAGHTKAIGQYDYHRGSWAKAAMAFLMHELHPPKKVEEGIAENLNGSHYFEKLRAIIFRSHNSWTSFVWGSDHGEPASSGAGGQIMPLRLESPLIYNTSDSLSGSILEHRPFSIYSVLLACSIGCAIASYLTMKKNFQPRIFIFLCFMFLQSLLFIGAVDFFFTLPLQVPRTVIPRFILAFWGILWILCGIIFIWQREKISPVHGVSITQVTNSFMFSLLIIPVSIFLMMRTPWIEFLNFRSLFSAVWVFIIVIISSLFMLFNKPQNRIFLRIAFFLVFLFLVLNALLQLHSQTLEPFYLRLVSIRNIQRIQFAGIVSVIVLSSGIIIGYSFNKKLIIMNSIFFSGIFIFSAMVVAILSFGRFNIPKIERMEKELSDDGFFTFGQISSKVATKQQAFFCFDKGPSITFLKVWGKKDAFITYSGLPVSFYQRDNFVDSRLITYENGKEQIRFLNDAKSNWWCLDNKLGLVFTGGEEILSGTRRIGPNWARTESYRDKIDVVYASPLRKKINEGDLIVEIAAVLKPNANTSDLNQMRSDANKIRITNLPKDWAATLLPVKDLGLFWAIASFSKQSAKASLTLSFNGWSPVLSSGGTIDAGRLRLEPRLQSFGAIRDDSCLLAQNVSDSKIYAKKVNANHYKFVSESRDNVVIKLKWWGPKIKKAVMTTENGERFFIREKIADENGIEVEFNKECCLEVTTEDSLDTFPPFVEVASPLLTENNQLKITVNSKDRSGLNYVQLFMDGKGLSTIQTPPYEWLVTPKNDIHSFYAIAVDKSDLLNKRRSFSTVWQKNR